MYFKLVGFYNILKIVEFVIKIVNERNINYIVVVLCSGSIVKFLKDCGKNVVVVIYVNGFFEFGKMEIS